MSVVLNFAARIVTGKFRIYYDVQVTSSSLVVGKIRRNEAITHLVITSPALIQLLVRSLPTQQAICRYSLLSANLKFLLLVD